MGFGESGVDNQSHQAWQTTEQRRKHLWNIMDIKSASSSPERSQRRFLLFVRSNDVRYNDIFLTIRQFSSTECVDN
jgi:hypothetical protein